ncbi:hypothetical protein GALMADRAFT_280519 [Galerina marginata CBS 339.88]|uniref:Uncharacterized protein n=1 Tax=Galerina marginata (strain CBS 339.88) TaxID=685588 RepID=A0A067T4S4_GALM3|nr:hypothetical protein GALMADRAFT_280519 [Galerina marginata CBS 339.88]
MLALWRRAPDPSPHRRCRQASLVTILSVVFAFGAARHSDSIFGVLGNAAFVSLQSMYNLQLEIWSSGQRSFASL